MNKFVQAEDATTLLGEIFARFRSHLAQARVAATDDLSADTVVEALRASGLLCAPLDPSQGGISLALPEACDTLFAALRATGACDLSAARLFEGHVNAVMLVNRFGTPEQRAAFAGSIRDGAFSGVWGADGADPLRADVSRGEVRLQGSKVLASGAGLAQAAIATARTDSGPLMLILGAIPADRIDLAGWTPTGMAGSATGRVDLTGYPLSATSILGEAGDFLRQPHFSGGAWRFCAAHLGAAERLLDLFRDHLTARDRGSDPYQLQRIADCTMAVTTAALWIGEAAERLADPDREAAQTVAFANLTRAVTERTALDVIETVQRGIGLSAFLRPHPAEAIMRDLATYLRQPVPDLAMSDAARTVLASDRPTAQLWI